MSRVDAWGEFPIVIWNVHNRVNPRCWTPTGSIIPGSMQEFCSLVLVLFTSLGLCHGSHSADYKIILGYLFVLNVPKLSNKSEYYCFNCLALEVTIAMLLPTLNTPISVAVVFPRSDIPLPLIARTSAHEDLSQTPIVHLKLSFTGYGRFDTYEYS